MTTSDISHALEAYRIRNNLPALHLEAALIDMDGVLYDSMKYHTLAWHRMMTELGIECTREEFYLYEGMTGRATIELLIRRGLGRETSPEECERLYRIKTRYFSEFGKREQMAGASLMCRELCEAGLKRVLVTGSGQKSLIETIENDYPGVFLEDMRVTAADVTHGKPHPEPYLRGLEKAGVKPTEAMVIENAPLGVQAGHAAGCFVVAVTTGPISADKMTEAGADLVFPSMENFAAHLPHILAQCPPSRTPVSIFRQTAALT